MIEYACILSLKGHWNALDIIISLSKNFEDKH